MTPPARLSRELQTRFHELRDAGASVARRRDAYNRWFRQCCIEGHPPDALRADSPDETERFWARTVSGPEAHIYWTGSKEFRLNNKTHRKPQRWSWAASGRPLNAYTELENICGEENCVNPEHMRIRPRGERRVRFSDERSFGALQVLALRYGRTPTTREWDEAKLPVSSSAMQNRFGNWNSFCRKAGLEVRAPGTLTPETCEEAIRALAAHIGHPPSARDWDTHREWLRARQYPTSPGALRNKLGGSISEIVARVLNDQKAA